MTFWIVLTAAADAADATELLLVLLHTGCSMLAMGFCGQLWRWLWANTVNQLQTGVQMLPNCSVRAGMDCCSNCCCLLSCALLRSDNLQPDAPDAPPPLSCCTSKTLCCFCAG